MMKKSLIAMAALAASGAFAQSSVTISGQLDAGLGMRQAAMSGAKTTGIFSGQFGASRLRFVGVEDMGGGQRANFWLELQPGMNDGSTSAAGLFNRGAWLGLSGDGWGEIRLGRQGTVTIGTVCAVDQLGCYGSFSGGGILFNGNGAGLGANGATGEWISANPTRGGVGQAISTQSTTSPPATLSNGDVTRVVNGFTYLTPKMGGFSAQAQYAFANLAATGGNNSNSSSSLGLQGQFAQGPVYLSAAYQQANKDAATDASGKLLTLGGTYDFTAAKIGLIYQRETASGSAAIWTAANAYALTLTVPVGAFTPYAKFGGRKVTSGAVTGNMSQVLDIGATYAMSKRTKLYIDYAKDTKIGAFDNVAYGAASTGSANPSIFQLGIQHTF